MRGIAPALETLRHQQSLPPGFLSQDQRRVELGNGLALEWCWFSASSPEALILSTYGAVIPDDVLFTRAALHGFRFRDRAGAASSRHWTRTLNAWLAPAAQQTGPLCLYQITDDAAAATTMPTNIAAPRFLALWIWQMLYSIAVENGRIDHPSLSLEGLRVQEQLEGAYPPTVSPLVAAHFFVPPGPHTLTSTDLSPLYGKTWAYPRQDRRAYWLVRPAVHQNLLLKIANLGDVRLVPGDRVVAATTEAKRFVDNLKRFLARLPDSQVVLASRAFVAEQSPIDVYTQWPTLLPLVRDAPLEEAEEDEKDADWVVMKDDDADRPAATTLSSFALPANAWS